MNSFIPKIEKDNNNNKILSSKEALKKQRITDVEENISTVEELDLSLYNRLRDNLETPTRSTFNLGRNNKKFSQNKLASELNTSFSGVDTKMSISFPGGKPIHVGEVQTVTYSLYRPIEPVYSLGSAKPTGFVRGQRTIAGSIIFTVFDRNVLLNAFYNAYNDYGDKECVNQEYLTDELPPFDIHITFMNEYGVSAALVIYGAYIPTEGQVHSIEDMITENTVQYVAQDMTLMRPGDIT